MSGLAQFMLSLSKYRSQERMAWVLSANPIPAFRNIFSFLKKKEKGYLLQSGLIE